MDRKQRVIWDDNGTLVDCSPELNGFRSLSKALSIVAAQDKLYIGAELPFNHKYFDVATASTIDSVMTAQIWDGSTWRAVVDLKDETQATGGKTLSGSGLVSWAVDLQQSGWTRVFDTGAESASTFGVLTGLRIFNLYWMRITFSGATAATLNYVGERFSSDLDLTGLYPDLGQSALKTAFGAGASKTDWNEQAFAAAEAIVAHLRRENILIRREQIMDTSLFNEASIHKTAAIIYRGMGNGHATQRDLAEQEYKRALPTKYPEVDKDASGHASACEKTSNTTWLTR